LWVLRLFSFGSFGSLQCFGSFSCFGSFGNFWLNVFWLNWGFRSFRNFRCYGSWLYVYRLYWNCCLWGRAGCLWRSYRGSVIAADLNWIRTETVVVRFAVKAHENKQPNAAYDWDKGNENPSASFADVVKTTHCEA
jgi:hypothetical protein